VYRRALEHLQLGPVAPAVELERGVHRTRAIPVSAVTALDGRDDPERLEASDTSDGLDRIEAVHCALETAERSPVSAAAGGERNGCRGGGDL
jgi:hypothetical protein